jgi:predicted 3-demethylubiquinone-9 3-methyltransferase (glyoxalase superfamily)
MRGELNMSKITPTLWYDGTAEEAANFYVTLQPDSRIEAVEALQARRQQLELALTAVEAQERVLREQRGTSGG